MTFRVYHILLLCSTTVDDFLFAMRHLSSHDLDGHKIIREKPAIRIPQKGTVSRDGLLSGVRSSGRPVLVSDQGNVHLFQTKHNPDASYSIKNGVHMSLNMYIGSIPVNMLDGIFEARLLERLDSLSHLVESKLVGHAPVDVYETEELAQVVSDLHRWHSEREDNAEIVLDHFQQIRAEIAHGVAGVGKSIAETKRQIATLKRDLEADRLQPFIDAIDREDCYTALKNLRASLASLERKQKEADDMTRQIEENGKRLVRASKLWPDMSIEKRKMFIRLVTQSVQLHDTGCGFMEMVVTWHPFMGHPQREIAHIMVQHGNAGNWSPEEIATLTEQYPRSEKSELVRLLPKRSWRTIIKKAHTLGIQRLQRSAQSDIPIDLSFETREYIQEYHLCEPEIGRAWWRVSPIKHDGRF